VLADIQFICGNNCQVNRKVSDDLQIPLLGCNSHRLNLAVQEYLGFHFTIKSDNRTLSQKQRWNALETLSQLMSKLKTIKGKAKLQQYSDFVAIKANATRWSGNYRMVKRYFEIKENLEHYLTNKEEEGKLQDEIAMMMPNSFDNVLLKRLLKELQDFQDVSLVLQKCDGVLSLLEVRCLFDKLISDYGIDFCKYLDKDSHVVNNKEFEQAIVQGIRDDSSLTREQRNLLQCFEIMPSNGDEAESMEEPASSNYALNILNSGQKCRQIQTTYIDLTKIPVSSNIVERFFSQVKLNLTYLRNRLLPSTLETLMFLKMNKSLFNKMTVQKAIQVSDERN